MLGEACPHCFSPDLYSEAMGYDLRLSCEQQKWWDHISVGPFTRPGSGRKVGDQEPRSTVR